jgi:hypothetical protein
MPFDKLRANGTRESFDRQTENAADPKTDGVS